MNPLVMEGEPVNMAHSMVMHGQELAGRHMIENERRPSATGVGRRAPREAFRAAF
jgi:hypothetical protein